MRLLCDENVRRSIYDVLSQEGHDAVRVQDGLEIGFGDEALVRFCREEGRILPTNDDDLLRFDDHPGVLFLVRQTASPRSVATAVRRTEPLVGAAALETGTTRARRVGPRVVRVAGDGSGGTEGKGTTDVSILPLIVGRAVLNRGRGPWLDAVQIVLYGCSPNCGIWSRGTGRLVLTIRLSHGPSPSGASKRGRLRVCGVRSG